MKFLLIFFLLFCCSPLQAEVPRLLISLPTAEDQALNVSPSIKTARSDLDSLSDKAKAQYALLWPKVSLDGSFRYVTEVPNLTLPAPGAKPLPFGDNEGYSIGPSLNWTMWDSKNLYHGWKSAQAAQESKRFELEAAQKRILFSVRLAYFQTQMALEQVKLVGESLLLVSQQYDDIEKRRKAGASTRIDSLSAHQEVLARQRQLQIAQMDLSSALRELLSLTQAQEVDASSVMEETMLGAIPAEIETPSLFLALDPVAKSFDLFSSLENAGPDLRNPRLESLSRMAESLRLHSKAIASTQWPKILFSARTSLDYPNGPILEKIHQNTLGLTFSMPLFETGRTAHQAREQKNLAVSAEQKRKQFELEILRDWNKAKDHLKSLRRQQVLNEQSVKETQELARLIYDSYKAGYSKYLDVQTANVRHLEMRIQSVHTNIQILMQLSILGYLSADRGAK